MWRKESESTQAVCVCGSFIEASIQSIQKHSEPACKIVAYRLCLALFSFLFFWVFWPLLELHDFFSQLVAKSLKSVLLVGCVYYINCRGD